ncbi:DNA pilot protein [Tortoise microvirus 21]|nr:DNA pilot protein [Tortoise microvirus 21]
MGLFDFILKPVEMALNYQTQGANRDMQWEINERNIELMREAWGREDQAVQRRAADLQAAGFNRVLAAGQGATTMGPVKLDAHSKEQVHMGQMATVDAAMNMMRMRDDFMTSKANRDYIAAQKDLVRAQTDKVKQDTSYGFESFNMRLSELENTILIQGENQALIQLQQENMRLRNLNQVSQNTMAEVEAIIHDEVTKTNLSRTQQDIVRLEIENYVQERDAAMREEIGIPSSGSIQEKGIQFIRNSVNNIVDRLQSSSFAPARGLGKLWSKGLEFIGQRRQ